MKKLISRVLCLMIILCMAFQAYAITVVKVTGIKLDKSAITMEVGQSQKLNVSFTPANTTQKLLTFATSDKNVVSVDANGTVTAVKAGKAVVTVTSQSNTSLTAKVTITVKEKPWVTLSVEVFDRGNVGGTAPDNNYWSKWIQKEFGDPRNIKLKFVTCPRWEEVNKLNVWMASNQAPDVSILYDVNTVFNYYKSGGLTRLDDALNTYGQQLKEFLGKDVLDRGRYYGEQWSIPAKRVINARFGTWIRQDWLDELDLPTPTTRDEWYNAMKLFKEKNPGKVGRVIPYGVTRDILWTATNLLESFMTDKSDYTRYLTNGNLRMFAPGYKEGVRFLNKMYNEGLMSSEFYLDKDGKLFERDYTNGYIGGYIQNYDMPLRPGAAYLPTVQEKIKGFDLQPIDPFKDMDGVTTKELYDQAGLRIIVPKSSEARVNEAMQYLNWMADTDVIFYLQFGDLGEGHIINDAGLPVYQDVKAGDKQFNSPQNIDYTLIINGVDTGDADMNIRINSLSYGDMGDLYVKAYKLATVNGFVMPALSIPTDADATYSNTLREKGYEFFAKTVTCKPQDFEKTWTKMITEYMKAGASEVLEERRIAWAKERGDER
jgi:putative aldouronate transport system substrate-binding protein